MKALKSLLVAIILALAANLCKSQISASLTFDISDLTIDTIGIYTQPSFAGCQYTHIIGAPHMPVIIKQYLLPKNAEITSLSFSDSTNLSLPDSYIIYPTQNPIITDGRPAPPFVEPDSVYYSSASRYNGNIVEIASLTNYMGYHLVRLKISPLQYIALDSTLIYFTTISFTINYQISGTDPLIKKMTEHQYNGIIDYISKTVENPQDISSFGPICETLEDDYEGTRPLNLFFLPSAGGDVVEYLIITNDHLKDSFEELAEWKTSKGIPALVVTTSQIEEYYPGFDLAEKIFNYLKDVFNNWNAVYVLLGGDTYIIPARVVLDDLGGYRVSDLYYADVADDNNPDYCWDSNHNGDFTDDDANLNLEADLFAGRVPVRSPIEAVNFISKILYYEKNTFPDQNKNISMIGAYLGDCHNMNDPPSKNVLGMRDWWNPVTDAGFIPNDFSITKIYDDREQWDGDMELNYQNVLWALDDNIDIAERQHIIAHIDHSGFNSIGTSVNCKSQSLSFSELDNLTYTNGSIYKIILGAGCESNEFDKDCFAEHCINGNGIDNEHNGIAIAYIGNSGLGEAHEYNQGYEFFNSLYNIPKVNLGKIFNETRKVSLKNSTIKKLNFLGDPELPVWTDLLSDLSIQTIPVSLTVGENQLEVIINGLQSGEEATVCIQKESEVYGVQITQTYENIHKAIFPDIKPDSEGDLQIVATAPNHHFAEMTVEVNPKPEVHLYIEDISPSDYYLIRGENDFKLVLANAGSSITATGISTTLSSLSEFVEISPFSPPESGFDPIEPGHMQESQESYIITVSNQAGNLSFIWLQLDIECDQGDFTEKFVLQLKAPQITYRGNKISTTSGNEDIFIDAGEIVSFKVELLNSGCLGAKAISASISEDSDDIEDIIIGTIYFREMSAHDTAWSNGVFKVQIANELPPLGIDFNLTLNINYDGIDHSFPITIGNELKPEDLSFTSTDSYITLNWTHDTYNRYNIYKLDPDDLPPGKDIEDSTYYKRLNFYISQSSSFTDINVDPAKVYYYKVTEYTNDKLSQGPYTPAFKAWTSLGSLEPWPVFIPENGVGSDGSPILFNAIPTRDNSDNPELEIFFPTYGGYDNNGLKSALYAFYSTGDELYDIDQNVNTYAGFANFSGVYVKATPIVGDMNGDSFGEIAFATSEGDPQVEPDLKKILFYSANDQDQDSYPDNLWEIQLDQAVESALVGANLDDNENYINKIFAAEIWHGYFDIRNTSDGSCYNKWQVINQGETKNLGIPVICDLDNDIDNEIIIGAAGIMGSNANALYIYNPDGSYFNSAPYIPQNTIDLVGIDCNPVVADIDNDNSPEIILLAVYSSSDPNDAEIYFAHIFALNSDQNEVENWEIDNPDHIISISKSINNPDYPSLTVADLDSDESMELLIADANRVWVWKANGDLFNENFPIIINNLELKCPGIAPLVANIDSDPANEIIIASNSTFDEDYIFAFNTDGTQVEGWPLLVNGLMATPAIGDINHDGLNEIVAVYGGYVNVWKTEGETGHDQWPLYRLNSFNNAVYEEPACDYDPNNPWVIDPQVDPLVWDSYRLLTRDIVIPDGVTLTITGRVAMPDDSKIIVEQGGVLNIDGGVITSACGGMWDGIQVWGYSDKSQLDLDFPPGEVELSSDALIENARIAIAAIKFENGTEDYNFTGGIVSCKDSKFLNNMYAIRFYSYRNFSPSHPEDELNNWSYIRNCTFETNGRLAEQNAHPEAFIRMDEVYGVRLAANHFLNTCDDVYPWHEKGIGIESYNAGYFIEGICLNSTVPCSLMKRNYFFNLNYGIRASGYGMERWTVSIAYCDFNLNKKGVFISALDNARIIFNTFTIEKEFAAEPPNYGIYIETSTGYSVEENLFSGKYPGDYGNIGLYISNSGTDPNQVYRNEFSHLPYGIVAYGVNRAETGEGLCLKCNNFDYCMNDIHVIPEKDEYGNWLRGRNQGIASEQGTTGSNTAPAGNTFTKDEDVPQEFNYFNHDNCNYISYNYHGDNQTDYKIEPDPHSPAPLVNPVADEHATFVSKDDACPSNYGGGSINTEMEKGIVSSENELVTLYSDSIQSLLDGGDTYSLNFDVNTSTTDEAYEIRQQLLDESPYLSDTVMKSAIYKENVLPNAMIRDVLVANPQSAKSPEILEKAVERMDPMPEEMMEEILEGLYIKGNLEILEDKMASHKTAKYQALHKLESYYKHDTLCIQGSRDSLVSFWSTENDPEILYKLAFIYLFNNDSTNCFEILNSIPQLSTLSDFQMEEYNGYSTLFDILYSVKQDRNNLDSVNIGQLMDIISGYVYPGCMARNVLIANNIIEYNEPIYLAGELKSAEAKPDKSGNNARKNSRLTVFPNPTQDYIIISYDLKGKQGYSSIILSNLEGKPCLSQDLTGIVNQMVIPLKGLASGIYLIHLVQNGMVIESKMFVKSN